MKTGDVRILVIALLVVIAWEYALRDRLRGAV